MNEKCYICQKESNFRCSRCKKIFYCSKECQKKSKKNNSNSKININIYIDEDKEKGKCIKVKKKFFESEVVYKDISILTFEKPPKKSLGGLEIFEYYYTSIFSFVKKNKGEREKILSLYYSDCHVKESEKESDMLISDTLRERIRNNEYFEINKIDDVLEEDIVKLLLICRFNTFSIDKRIKYFKLYEFASRVNHSCDPNCIFLHKDDCLIIRAIKPIKKDEEITVSYFNETKILYATHIRKEMLSNVYGFNCACKRCNEIVDKTRIYSCKYCKAGEIYLSVQPWKCSKCRKVYEDEDYIREVLASEKILEVNILNADHDPNALVHEIQMRTRSSVLNPSTIAIPFKRLLLSYFGTTLPFYKNHWLKFLALDIVRDVSGKVNNGKVTKSTCLKVIKYYKKFGSLSRRKMWFLYKDVIRFENDKSKRKEFERKMKKIEKLFPKEYFYEEI